jgi:hypothetical protein
MRRRPVLYGSLAIVAVGFLVGCGDDPSPVAPSLPSPSAFASLQVMGPDSLRAGQSAQFVASIRQADGTTKSATSMPNLAWRSSNDSIMSVSQAGMVTVGPSASGEALITAEFTNQPGVRGTREVVVLPRAVVAGTLEVTQTGTGDKVRYVFAVKLTESNGVPATVTEVWINLGDDGWDWQCSFDAARLGQTRVPANGALALDPLTCDYPPTLYAGVSLSLTDDNGYKVQLDLRWASSQ